MAKQMNIPARKASASPRKSSLLEVSKERPRALERVLWAHREGTDPGEGWVGKEGSEMGWVSFLAEPLGQLRPCKVCLQALVLNEPGPGQNPGALSPVSLLLWSPLVSSARRSCRAHSGGGGRKACRRQRERRGCRGHRGHRDWTHRAQWACRTHWSWHRGCRAA